jgi:hypothetical protein
MSAVVVVCALVVAALNVVAAGLGALQWWLVRPGRAFWVALRVAQGAAVVFAVVAGGYAAGGDRPDDGLFWLYALLPIPVAFIAEQLRLTSATAVLDARGLPDAQAMGRLPADEQRSIVLQIMQREAAVMAISAAVVVFLALRAASTA